MIISVEGIMGAGKTRFIHHLRDINHCTVYEEPVSKHLPLFYASPRRWAFTVQLDMLAQRIALLRKTRTHTAPAWMDRSLFGDQVFATVNAARGLISSEELKLYNTVRESLVQTAPQVDVVLYLRVPPVVALGRIKRRGDRTDADITPRYLEQLHAAHEHQLHALKKNKKIVIAEPPDAPTPAAWTAWMDEIRPRVTAL